MNKTVVIIIIVVIVGVVGAFVLLGNNSAQKIDFPEVPVINTNTVNSGQPDTVGGSDETIDGEILAGTASRYYAFSASAFEQAMASDKIVFLEFYANWCPVCRAEQPEIVEGFNQLERNDVVGLRANYNDDETDAAEKALAQQLGVTYQHTKIIFRNGKEVHRDGVPWNIQDFLDAIESASE